MATRPKGTANPHNMDSQLGMVTSPKAMLVMRSLVTPRGGYAGGYTYNYQVGAYQSGYRSQAYRGAYSCWCFYQGYWYYTCGR